jgi:hypothetical protein
MAIYSLNFLNYNIIMARFYDPRQGREDEPFDTRIGNKGRLQYDPSHDSGTSGAESSDLRPEQAYDTDLRRIEPDERNAVESLNSKQDQIAKYFAAARSAGKFKQKASIDEPTIRGKTPRTEANIAGTALPSMGDTIGKSGSTNYSDGPKAFSGTFRGFGGF